MKKTTRRTFASIGVLVVIVGVASCSTQAPSPVPSTSGECTPGQQLACACSGGESGSQTCTTDGKGFGPCVGCAIDLDSSVNGDASGSGADAAGDATSDVGAVDSDTDTSVDAADAGDEASADAAGSGGEASVDASNESGADAAETGTDASSDASDAGVDSGPDAADAGDLSCGQATTLASCTTCCTNNHPTGATAFCSDVPASCCSNDCLGTSCTAAQCANLASIGCGGLPGGSGAACNACVLPKIAPTGICTQSLPANCNSDAQCLAYATCFKQECAGKP